MRVFLIPFSLLGSLAFVFLISNYVTNHIKNRKTQIELEQAHIKKNEFLKLANNRELAKYEPDDEFYENDDDLETFKQQAKETNKARNQDYINAKDIKDHIKAPPTLNERIEESKRYENLTNKAPKKLDEIIKDSKIHKKLNNGEELSDEEKEHLLQNLSNRFELDPNNVLNGPIQESLESARARQE